MHNNNKRKQQLKISENVVEQNSMILFDPLVLNFYPEYMIAEICMSKTSQVTSFNNN